MKEGEWFASTEPGPMLRWLQVLGNMGRTQAGKRRLRLFLCACCRRLVPLVGGGAGEVVDLAERFADRLADKADLARGKPLLQAAGKGRPDLRPALSALGAVLRPSLSVGDAVEACRRAADAAGEPREAELAVHCDLLREVFADGYRRSEKKLPAHVMGLAEACYTAFPAVSDRFLVLADALEELGEAASAAHCREPRHVKGCHVLDWIRGKL